MLDTQYWRYVKVSCYSTKASGSLGQYVALL